MAGHVPKNTTFDYPEPHYQCERRMIIRHFMTKFQVPNLHQTGVNMFLSINISNSKNLNKFWDGIFKRQGHINQVY